MSYALERADNMIIERNVTIQMDDGTLLRADVFRPEGQGKFPVLMTYGPYAKGLHFADGYAPQWKKLNSDFPEVGQKSSTRHANWETVDPERWVPDGYVC